MSNSMKFLFLMLFSSPVSSVALTIGNFTNCNVNVPQWVGDGGCDGGEYNTVECGYDGGDCDDFNMNYPNCDVEYPFLIANGLCDGVGYNTPECGYDGGDCEMYNTYPQCNVTNPKWLGDLQCDLHENEMYHTKECGYDFGDCIAVLFPNCTVDDTLLLGNGECNGGSYNVEACEYDGGDCDDFNQNYPNCVVDNPTYIGNGQCDGGPYNTTECGLDGGDCVIFINNELDDDANIGSTNESSHATLASLGSFTTWTVLLMIFLSY
jgi:hypothetical protein